MANGVGTDLNVIDQFMGVFSLACLVLNVGTQNLDRLRFVARIIDPRPAVEAMVMEARPAARSLRAIRGWRIGCDARDAKICE